MKFTGVSDYIDSKYEGYFSITPKYFTYNDLSCNGMKTIKIPVGKSEQSYYTGKDYTGEQYEILEWRGEWLEWANCHLGIKIQTWNRKEVFITSVGLRTVKNSMNKNYKDIDIQSSIIVLDHKSYFYFAEGFISVFASNCGAKDTDRIANGLVAYSNYLAFTSLHKD